jgi:hypothetical protein
LSTVLNAYVAHPAALVGFVAWVLLAAVRFRPPRQLADVLAARHAVRAALSAGLAGGAVASFAEDSSVVVMVLLVLYAAVALAVASLGVAKKEV